MSPLGIYPRKSISVGCSHFIIEKEVALSVVSIFPEENHGVTLEHFSEIDFLSLEEIRLYGALLLSHPTSCGTIYLYPLSAFHDIRYLSKLPKSGVDLAREFARSLPPDSFDLRGAIVPPLLGGPKYKCHDFDHDAKLVEEIFGLIELRDHLLMRGLSSLITCGMLWQREEFQVAAMLSLYVALEASFQLILRELRSQGISNPDACDAGEFLDAAFNPHLSSGRYFHEYYDDRIKVIHPASRLGVFPFAPLQADDYYFLRADLIEVYFYLLTGCARQNR